MVNSCGGTENRKKKALENGQISIQSMKFLRRAAINRKPSPHHEKKEHFKMIFRFNIIVPSFIAEMEMQ